MTLEQKLRLADLREMEVLTEEEAKELEELAALEEKPEEPKEEEPKVEEPKEEVSM